METEIDLLRSQLEREKNKVKELSEQAASVREDDEEGMDLNPIMVIAVPSMAHSKLWKLQTERTSKRDFDLANWS